jgi:hypothetical protein
MTYEYRRAAMGQGVPVYAESSIESGVPGVVEARQITPTGEKGPLIPVDTDFARPIGRRGPLVPYATEYARRIGRHGPKGPLIPLGTLEEQAGVLGVIQRRPLLAIALTFLTGVFLGKLVK